MRCSYNSAGLIDLILISDVTGDAYTYGRAVTGSKSSGSSGLTVDNGTVRVDNGDGGSDTLITSRKFTDGSFIGVAGSAAGKLTGSVTLKKTAVERADFTGSESVTVGDNEIPVSDAVQVYNSSSGTWTTLALAKAYAETFTVYYDKTPETGAKIRIVVF